MKSESYLDVVADLYRDAALTPQEQLCCTTTPTWKLPDLAVPPAMIEMNYGCGSTVSPQDLDSGLDVLYVGVGAGLEALQFAYFTRHPGGVVAVDRVPEMLDLARRNFDEAAQLNHWFDPSFIELRPGDALQLPVDDASIDVAAQNCLFNIFTDDDLVAALAEMRRVLKPGGRLVLSDPVAPTLLPPHLQRDDRLRAMCLSGAQTYDRYIDLIVAAGFGTIEVRSRRPYRILDRQRYGLDANIVLESVEVAAIADAVAADGPCVFTGRTATWVGAAESFDDGAGHVLLRDLPAQVCDKTATNLERLGDPQIVVTASTFHYNGGGCC